MKNQRNTDRLRKTLQINAIFSGLSGLAMSTSSHVLAALMGVSTPSILAILGLSLMSFAGFLVWLSRRPLMPQAMLWAVVTSDLAWVFASLIGLALVPHQLTPIGVFLILDVAAIVTGFACFQLVFIRQQSRATV